MKGLLSFCKSTLVFLLLISAIYFGGYITINFMDKSINIHIATVILLFIVSFYLYGFLKNTCLKFLLFLHGKPSHEKGIDNLQLAFSGILLKDQKLVSKSIEKAKRYLGNIPLISWIEGQLLLMNNDYHKAKALFYELSGRETDTVFGAYGLCKMSTKDRQETDVINAINAILKIAPNAFELVFQALLIHLKNKEFTEAKKHITSIRKTKNGRIVEAIIYAEEGNYTRNIEMMRKAFELAPELSENAQHYAELLIDNQKFHDARQVLLKALMHTPAIELYKKYISSDESLSNSEKLKLAEKAVKAVPNSWIVYFEFGCLAAQNGMTYIAFQNFFKAYKLKEYDFIAQQLIKSVKTINDPKIKSVTKVLSFPLTSKNVTFIWECSYCGTQDAYSKVICENCGRIAPYKLQEKFTSDITHLL